MASLLAPTLAIFRTRRIVRWTLALSAQAHVTRMRPITSCHNFHLVHQQSSKAALTRDKVYPDHGSISRAINDRDYIEAAIMLTALEYRLLRLIAPRLPSTMD